MKTSLNCCLCWFFIGKCLAIKGREKNETYEREYNLLLFLSAVNNTIRRLCTIYSEYKNSVETVYTTIIRHKVIVHEAVYVISWNFFYKYKAIINTENNNCMFVCCFFLFYRSTNYAKTKQNTLTICKLKWEII